MESIEVYGDMRLAFSDTPVIETDLTDEERAIIRAGREEYKAGGFVPLSCL